MRGISSDDDDTLVHECNRRTDGLTLKIVMAHSTVHYSHISIRHHDRSGFGRWGMLLKAITVYSLLSGQQLMQSNKKLS